MRINLGIDAMGQSGNCCDEGTLGSRLEPKRTISPCVSPAATLEVVSAHRCPEKDQRGGEAERSATGMQRGPFLDQGAAARTSARRFSRHEYFVRFRSCKVCRSARTAVVACHCTRAKQISTKGRAIDRASSGPKLNAHCCRELPGVQAQPPSPSSISSCR